MTLQWEPFDLQEMKCMLQCACATAGTVDLDISDVTVAPDCQMYEERSGREEGGEGKGRRGKEG